MTVDADCSQVVGNLARRMAGETEERYWSACAALWARAFAETREGRARWPEQYGIALDALGHALTRATAHRHPGGDPAAVLEVVRERLVPDDDGSAEWGRSLVFFEMVEWALDGSSEQQCLYRAAQAYLEEVFRIVALDQAEQTPGRTISQADALRRVPSDPRWHDAVRFIEAI